MFESKKEERECEGQRKDRDGTVVWRCGYVRKVTVTRQGAWTQEEYDHKTRKVKATKEYPATEWTWEKLCTACKAEQRANYKYSAWQEALVQANTARARVEAAKKKRAQKAG